jgi:hypothetical protein
MSERVFSLVGWLSVAILLGACGLRATSDHRTPDFVLPQDLMEGDLLFRRGSGLASMSVMALDPLPEFSHVGIVVQVGGEFRVVHAVPGDAKEDDGRVVTSSLEQFARKAAPHQVVGYRLNESVASVARLARQQAAAYAKRLAEKQVLFDHDYDLNSDARVYCTELVWRAYLAGGVDIADRDRSHRVEIGGRRVLVPGNLAGSSVMRRLLWS